MSFLRKFWPISFKVENGKQLATAIIIYVIVGILLFAVSLVFSFIPGLAADILETVVNCIDSLYSIYALAGIVFSILKFKNVFKA